MDTLTRPKTPYYTEAHEVFRANLRRFVARQIHGGMGSMRGTKVERIYREVKVNAIGGGAEEIMKELAARQLGL